MPFLSPDALSLVDIFLLLVILIGMPLESLLSRGPVRARIRAGVPGARVRLYRQTMILLWGVALPILLVWLVGGRSWADLGFRLEAGWMSWAGWGLAALLTGFFLWQYVAVRTQPAFREKYRDSLSKAGDSLYFMPETATDHKVFRLTGITAGITEEIIFRGYLFWSLGMVMPLWAAAGLSLAVFVFLHIYQGVENLGAVFVTGAIVTAVVLMTGSLWPAIALHILIDILNIDTVWIARTAPELVEAD